MRGGRLMDAMTTSIDRRIEQFRQAEDAEAAAAWLLRHRNICPVCLGRAGVTNENAVTSKRIFRCGACQWTAIVSETAYRGAADITLRETCRAALLLRKAREGPSMPRSRGRRRASGSRRP